MLLSLAPSFAQRRRSGQNSHESFDAMRVCYPDALVIRFFAYDMIELVNNRQSPLVGVALPEPSTEMDEWLSEHGPSVDLTSARAARETLIFKVASFEHLLHAIAQTDNEGVKKGRDHKLFEASPQLLANWRTEIFAEEAEVAL